MTTPTRLIAKIVAQPIKPRVRNLRGLPRELATDHGSRTEMPIAEALLIEVEADGVFLFRLSADGQFAGDTWHESVEEAKEQAKFEFGPGLSNWSSVPAEIEDVLAYAKKLSAP